MRNAEGLNFSLSSSIPHRPSDRRGIKSEGNGEWEEGQSEVSKSVDFIGPIMVGVKVGAAAEETTANSRDNLKFLKRALASI